MWLLKRILFYVLTSFVTTSILIALSISPKSKEIFGDLISSLKFDMLKRSAKIALSVLPESKSKQSLREVLKLIETNQLSIPIDDVGGVNCNGHSTGFSGQLNAIQNSLNNSQREVTQQVPSQGLSQRAGASGSHEELKGFVFIEGKYYPERADHIYSVNGRNVYYVNTKSSHERQVANDEQMNSADQTRLDEVHNLNEAVDTSKQSGAVTQHGEITSNAIYNYLMKGSPQVKGNGSGK